MRAKRAHNLAIVAFLVGCASLMGPNQAAASLHDEEEVQIIGSLSNFDVWNKTGDWTDRFEIEFHGIDSSDINRTYRNGLFPAAQIVPFASGVRVIYDGRSRGTRIDLNMRQHFGVSLRSQPQRTIYNPLVAPLGDPEDFKPFLLGPDDSLTETEGLLAAANGSGAACARWCAF